MPHTDSIIKTLVNSTVVKVMGTFIGIGSTVVRVMGTGTGSNGSQGNGYQNNTQKLTDIWMTGCYHII